MSRDFRMIYGPTQSVGQHHVTIRVAFTENRQNGFSIPIYVDVPAGTEDERREAVMRALGAYLAPYIPRRA